MFERCNGTTAGKQSIAALPFVSMILCGWSGLASAADHAISPQASTFNCSSVRAGDTITLASGARGPLVISDCNGTASNPITIRNDSRGSGPTVIRNSAGSSRAFVFACNDCVGVVIDGSNKWSGAPNEDTYGIKVTMTGGEAPTAFMRIGGLSRYLTIRNVEVDGAWPALAHDGIGISVNDHSIKHATHPGHWREGILIEHSYVHDVASEGLYVGPPHYYGDLPLRNIEIRRNRIEDIGWNAINTKSMWEGNNSIHHNVIRRVGKNSSTSENSWQYSAITNISGAVKIYNNWIESSGQHGISQWTGGGPFTSEGKGPFDTYIWNNVIVNAGALWQSFMGESHGINVGAQDGCEKPVPYIFNNTIVNSRQNAVRLAANVGGGFVKDNIVADAGSTPIIAPTFVAQANNRVGAVSQMAFMDAANSNFRLRASSPARNQTADGIPETDFDGVSRPQDGASDQGAFEYSSETVAVKPQAPRSLIVE